MKFSLKTMLLSLCLAGAALGMMGNLLLRKPEAFFIILDFASTVLPFALAAGTVIWLGARRPRRPRLIFWGVFLLLLPFVLQGSVALFLPSRDPLQILSTKRLIAERLPQRLNEPWVWQELARRIASGDLTRDDVEAAMQQLIGMMKSTKPTGWNQPLSWQREFVQEALQAGVVSDETLVELWDAFYGPQPVIQPVPKLSGRERGFRLQISYGNPWSDNSNLNVELLWNVAKISIDGKPINFKQEQRFGEIGNVYCEVKLEPGEHEVTIDFDCAYVDPRLLTGSQNKSQPTAGWPQTKKRWTKSVTVPVTVEATQDATVK